MKVLLVEDEPLMAKAATRIIQLLQQDVTVDAACNGEEALNCTSNNNYDLIFMDYGLPDIPGTQVTEKMREQGVVSPIVALSANIGQVGAEDMMKFGLDGAISKPLSKDKWEAVLEICAQKN